MTPEAVPVLVIGAGPAGLATAACLQAQGIAPVVLEQADAPGHAWRQHYQRLHLHTVKSHSALPGLPFPADAPRYVPRQGVVDYLEAYIRHHRLQPRCGQTVQRITRAQGHWQVHTQSGQAWAAPHVVLACGANRRPRWPELPGQSAYGGQCLHSRDYRDATPFQGQRVLVVGMGNTGAEIALDLAEHGVRVALSVRSPVNIVRRDVLGRPTQLSSLLLARLPPALGDWLASRLRDLTVGDLSRFGLQTARQSPLRQLREEGKTPVIDIGTVAAIRRGHITVHPGIAALTPDGARFTNGRQAPFDTIVCATGYDAALQDFFPDTPLPLDPRGMPPQVRGQGVCQGLWFVGYDVRQPGGLLRAIAGQAREVAEGLGGG